MLKVCSNCQHDEAKYMNCSCPQPPRMNTGLPSTIKFSTILTLSANFPHLWKYQSEHVILMASKLTFNIHMIENPLNDLSVTLPAGCRENSVEGYRIIADSSRAETIEHLQRLLKIHVRTEPFQYSVVCYSGH